MKIIVGLIIYEIVRWMVIAKWAISKVWYKFVNG